MAVSPPRPRNWPWSPPGQRQIMDLYHRRHRLMLEAMPESQFTHDVTSQTLDWFWQVHASDQLE